MWRYNSIQNNPNMYLLAARFPSILIWLLSACLFFGLSAAVGQSQPPTGGGLLPEWRWKGVLAAINDPSVEVQQTAVFWIDSRDHKEILPSVISQQLIPLIGVWITKAEWRSDQKIKLLSVLGWTLQAEMASIAPQVAELLKSPDDDVRRYAAEALGKMGTGAASFAPQVVELLKSTDYGTRKAAAEALGNMGTAAASFAPQVVELLKSPDYNIRDSAVEALGKMGTVAASAAPQVVELLKNPNGDVQESAVVALRDMGTAAANVAPQVAELLKSTDYGTRKAAAEALGNMRTEAASVAPQVAELLKSPRNDVRQSAAKVLGNMRTEAASFAPQVAELLKNPNRDVRQSAAKVLGNIGTAAGDVAPQVAEELKSPDYYDRQSALEVLGSMGTAAASFAPQVAKLLKNPNDVERRYAAKVLGSMGTAAGSFAPQVVELLKSSDLDNRLYALKALGNMGSAAASFAPQVADLLKNPNDVERQYAAEALGKMGTATASFAPQVVELLKSTDYGIRKAAAEALSKMGATAASFAPQVVELLKSPDYNIRDSAVEVLGNMGTAVASVAPQVADLLKSSDYDIRQSAAEALGKMGAVAASVAPQVAELLKNPEYNVRRSALEVLGDMGTAAANLAPQMAELLKSPDQDIRRSAAHALDRTGTAAANLAPQMAELLKSSDDVVQQSAKQALGDMGTAAASVAPQVAELLKNPEYKVRRSALEVLEMLGTAAASVAPQVAELLKSSYDNERQSAANVLVQLIMSPDEHIAFLCLESSHTNEKIRGDLIFEAYLNGGGDTTNQFYVMWLANRPLTELPKLKQLSRQERLISLKKLYDALDKTKNTPKVRLKLAGLVATFVREAGQVEPEDRKLLVDFGEQLRPEFPDQANTIDLLIHKNDRDRWLWKIGAFIGGHFVFWVGLIFFYPRYPIVQAVFFWNKWVRRIFGFGYVGLLITVVPFLRRRLFEPFRESLVPPSILASFPSQSYYQYSQVTRKGSRDNKRLLLASEVGCVHGQVVIEGSSGLGKTTLLQHLALSSHQTLAYLRASECGQGVVAAIQRKLHGQAQDEAYLESLIYAGAIDVLIDGLNEAMPDTRSEISRFVAKLFKGNFVLTTQPISWNPPATARIYTLQPMLPAQIKDFLEQQWDSVKSIARLSCDEYKVTVSEYIEQLNTDIATSNARSSELTILCNPMESSLAAELLAVGEKPDVFRLVEQRFQGAAEEFQERQGRDFPRKLFAERVFEWRLSRKPNIDVEGFESEAESLVEHKLLRRWTETQTNQKETSEVTKWVFRHDKIRDFFVAPAFMGDSSNRQSEYVDDERFSGVYEVLAFELPIADAKELQRFLVNNPKKIS